MLHTEIIINYGELDTAQEALRQYAQALSDMQEGVRQVWTALERGEGEAHDALLSKKELLLERIRQELEAAEDTLSILESYIADMTAIITPDIRGQRMLVDRNDIWGNMLTMEEKIGHLPTIDWFARVWAWETYTRNPDDKTRRKEESYYKRVQNVKKDIILPYGIRIASVFEELKSIYDNQVKPYENMDDDYEPITEANYHKHTDNWGVCELCSLDTPDWASDKLNTAGDTATALMEDPLLLVEGISQGATDVVEQKSITYLS